MPPNKPEESAQEAVINISESVIDYNHFINDFSKLREPSVIRELSSLEELPPYGQTLNLDVFGQQLDYLKEAASFGQLERNCVPSGHRQATYIDCDSPEDSGAWLGISYAYLVSHYYPDLASSKLYSQKNSEVISLAGGLPCPTSFPIEEIFIKLKDGSNICLKEKVLQDALQYIPTQGYPPLLQKLRELQWKVHRPPCWKNCEILITPGSQDGLCKAIEMSLEKGEPIIVQHPVYSGTKCLLKPFQADIIPVEQDENGMIPELLQEALEKRLKPEEAFSLKRGIPKLIYVNTTGANPTGVAITTERKKEIYRLACKYNLIILEDDPYYYLHFQDTYPTSFLSLDTEGRVLRFDSFSKIISPGLRIGFVTGPKQLIGRIELHVQAASLHATSLSQVIIDCIFEKWKFNGIFNHFQFIQNHYKAKRDAMIAAAKKYLTGLAEWNEPTAGMFLWIKVLELSDVYNFVTNVCIKKGIMLVTGHAYIVEKRVPCPYLRACYSLASEEQINTGMKRLAEAIREELEKQNDGANNSFQESVQE